MTFQEVMKGLKEGKRIRRNKWGAEVWTAIIDGEQVWSLRGTLSTNDPNDYLGWPDVHATGWEIA